MTILPQQNAINVAGQGCNPGGAPLGSGLMNGNPTNMTPTGAVVPTPQTGGAGQTVNTPLSHDLMSNGNLPLNVQPTNIGTGAGVGLGTDSLLAQLARGQVLLNQSTYGQGAFVAQNGGSSPQQPQPGAVNTVSQANGIASTLTVAGPVGN